MLPTAWGCVRGCNSAPISTYCPGQWSTTSCLLPVLQQGCAHLSPVIAHNLSLSTRSSLCMHRDHQLVHVTISFSSCVLVEARVTLALFQLYVYISLLFSILLSISYTLYFYGLRWKLLVPWAHCCYHYHHLSCISRIKTYPPPFLLNTSISTLTFQVRAPVGDVALLYCARACVQTL